MTNYVTPVEDVVAARQAVVPANDYLIALTH